MITSAQHFDFEAAQAANMISEDFGISVRITKGKDGFTRISPIETAPSCLDVAASTLDRAIQKFTLACKS